MAHFAELDENNIVLRVVVIADEHEEDGEKWCSDFFGGNFWKQTSYNASVRKNFAGAGYRYDASLDAFIPPQPFPSWVLDVVSCQWMAPTPYPSDGDFYRWDEDAKEWVNPQ